MIGAALKILVVEDDPPYFHKLEAMLAASSVKAVEIYWASSIADALEQIAHTHFDVCLLNSRLDGHCCAEIMHRGALLHSRTAFIVMSDEARKDWCYSALENGAMDYLLKNEVSDFGLMKSLAFSLYRKSKETELQALALRDSLTGMGNRSLFTEQAETLVRLSQRTREKIGVLFMDVDGMKPVNDGYGHDVGDKVLQGVAFRISERLRKGDVVSRWGGDEFVALLPGVESMAGVKQVAATLSHAVAQPYMIDGRSISIDLSCGGALYPDDSTDMDDLVRLADQRMYNTKIVKKKTRPNGAQLSWFDTPPT